MSYPVHLKMSPGFSLQKYTTMSLSLRINIVDSNVTKTIVFSSPTTVHDACRIIREKCPEATVQRKFSQPNTFPLRTRHLTGFFGSRQGLRPVPHRRRQYDRSMAGTCPEPGVLHPEEWRHHRVPQQAENFACQDAGW